MENNLPNMKFTDELFDGADSEWDITEDREGELSADKFDYNFILGNEKIVFIKAGAGGSARGYQDKYIKMAERIHGRNGATVICASNPINPICDAPDAQQIRYVASMLGFESFELYFLGVSDGAYSNLKLAGQFDEATKWVGINTSFIEMEDFKARLNALPRVSRLLIYGTEDDDFDEVVSELSEMRCDNLALKFVEKADHSFTDMLDEFIALADYI